MTHPAIAAAIQAATDFAAALEAVSKQLAAPVTVGSAFGATDGLTAWLDALPVGAQLRDSDGDTWTKLPGGGFSLEGPSGSETICRPRDYLPFVITSLPEAAEPEADPLADWERELLAATKVQALKAGDEVRITGLTIYEVDRIGRTGTVSRVESDDYIVVVIGEGWDTENRVFTRSALELVTPEPEPVVTHLRITPERNHLVSSGSQVRVEPSSRNRDGGAFIHITEGGMSSSAVHLTKAEARRIAATLTAIADA